MTPVPDTSKELTEGQLSLSLKSMFETWTLHPFRAGWSSPVSAASAALQPPLFLQNTDG